VILMRVHARRVVASGALIAAATLAIAALKPLAPVISLGALYIVVVLAAAVLWGLAYAVGVSIVSLLVFNWFFLPPVHTLALDEPSNWTALLVYLVTAVVTSELAARMRRRAAEAERREQDAALLADLAARLLEGGDLTELVARVERSDEPASARLEQAVAALVEIAKERERLELRAREAEALRRADAVKSSVIQAVSHDLRTPLATIETALDGLQSPLIGLSEAEQSELLDSVRLALERLKRFVENMLDLSRLQAGAAVPAQTLWTVDTLTEQALDELPDGRRVRVEVPAELPPVRTDAAQMQRALVNVLENALKFSPPDTAVVLRAEQLGNEIVLHVDDQGPGISADEAMTVFEPFQHARGSGGSGLGLAIARGFVDANGGRIWVETRASGGASVVIALPAADVVPVAT
jgi:two-component system, OmpR family, sensor histidine kinase KdpD